MAVRLRGRDLLQALPGVADIRRNVSIHTVYDFGAAVGKGTAGIVYEVTHWETGGRYACNVYSKQELRQLSRPETLFRIAQVGSA